MVLCSSRSCSTTQTQLCFGKLLPQVPLSHLHVPSMAWGPARPPHQGCSSKRCHQLPSPAPQGLPSLLRGTVRAHIHPEQHGMGLSTWGAAPQSRYAWYQLWASLLYLIHGFISSVALSRPRLYLVRGFISSVALSCPWLYLVRGFISSGLSPSLKPRVGGAQPGLQNQPSVCCQRRWLPGGASAMPRALSSQTPRSSSQHAG